MNVRITATTLHMDSDHSHRVITPFIRTQCSTIKAAIYSEPSQSIFPTNEVNV